jgi:hypothetical protein
MKKNFYSKLATLTAALLFFTYFASAQTTINVLVSDPNDDMEEQLSDEPEKHTAGYIDDGSSDLELGSEKVTSGGVLQITGVGFRDVQVPYGATVTNAYIQFTSDSDEDSNVTIYIHGEAAANSSLPFTETDFDISSRAQTTAVVEWTPVAWVEGARTADQQTPNLSAIVTEIIGDAAWVAGNNMTFFFEPPADTDPTAEGLHREGVPYETAIEAAKPNDVPELVITFETGGGTGVSSVSARALPVYPNPTSGVVNIANPSNGSFSYTIYTITGKRVTSSDQVAGEMATLDMSGFTKGIYFVDVVSAGKSETHKLVVK